MNTIDFTEEEQIKRDIEKARQNVEAKETKAKAKAKESEVQEEEPLTKKAIISQS